MFLCFSVQCVHISSLVHRAASGCGKSLHEYDVFFCVGLNFHLTCDAQFFFWDSSTSVSLFVDVITLFSYSTKKVDLIRRLSFCDLPCVLETGAFQLPKSSK